MSYEPRLIAPYAGDTGLVEVYKPWLIGDAAFAVLENAYTWRGRILKRDGYDELGLVPSEATITNITQGNPGVVTVTAIGNLQNGDIITIRDVPGMVEINGLTFIVAGIAANNFNLTTLAGVNFSTVGFTAYGVGTGTINLPVNGLANYLVRATVDEELVAFTRYKASIYQPGAGAFADISFFQTTGAAISWGGTLNGYYWSTNYAGTLWVTNNVNNIRFYNGNPLQGWNNQRFITNGAGHTVTRARIIIPYYGRLVLLDTTENGVDYYQRARFSQIGSPYVPASGADPAVVLPPGQSSNIDNWRDDMSGRGGYIDADTSERIISAAIINNTLIVFFQHSTWRLRYTTNQLLPFVWDRIDTTLGSEAQFSTIVHDNIAYSISRRGIIGADTNRVQRIDQRIPDRSFEIETGIATELLNIVSGIRDYYKKLFYWSVPSADVNAQTPNKIICYNFEDKSWSIFDIAFRVFGQYKELDDRTWAMMSVVNRDEWENQTENYWVNPFMQDNTPVVCAGHLNGFVYKIFEDVSDGTDAGDTINFDIQTKRFNPYIDKGQDCRLEYVDIYATSTTQQRIAIINITNASPGRVTTLLNHGLVNGSEILITGVIGMTEVNNVKFTVTVVNATNFDINVDTTNYGVYAGGGDMTNNAEITLEHYIDDNDTTPMITRTITLSAPGEEANYFRVYLGENARFHQIRLLLSPSQLADRLKGKAGVELQGMVIWTRPITRTKGQLL